MNVLRPLHYAYVIYFIKMFISNFVAHDLIDKNLIFAAPLIWRILTFVLFVYSLKNAV